MEKLQDLLLGLAAAVARRLEGREEGVTIIEYVALTAFVAALASALYIANIDDLVVNALKAAVGKVINGSG